MNIKEIDDKIRELDKQCHLLTQERNKLEKQKIDEFQRQAVEHIGKCFKVNGKEYAIIIDVPQNEYDRTGRSLFNQYQFPAIYLNDDVVPFADGTVFSGAWGSGHVMVGEYSEVSMDEFKIEFEKRVDQLRKICFGDHD